MTEATDRKAHPQNSGRFVLDGQYLRKQASEAVSTFLAPLSGVYSAATGRVGQRDSRKGETRKRA